MAAFSERFEREARAVAGFEAGKAQLLFPIRSFGNLNSRSHFDVSADGQRFLVLEDLEREPVQPVILMLNWLPGTK